MKKEEEISAINPELSDFLMGMSLERLTFVCVNSGNRMRGTHPICGQLWTQKNRQMTATSTILPGMGTPKEEVILSGIVDAITWRHTLEENDYEQRPNYMRLGQRVVMYQASSRSLKARRSSPM
jgi:hypothetical protein